MRVKWKRVRGWGLVLIFVVAGIGVVWLTRREMRQEALDVALIAAAKRRDEPAMLRLLAQGANPNARDMPAPKHTLWQLVYQYFFRRSAADKAAQNAPTPLSILYGNDPWFKNGHGHPCNECPLVVAALLDKGADPNVKTEQGNPILAANARLGYAATVRLLLQHGADVNARMSDGSTALIEAADNIEIVKALLASGANVNLRDEYGNTALLHAMRVFDPNITPAVLTALLSAHANVNIPDYDGATPLVCSVYQGDVEATHLLLAAGAQVNHRDGSGLTALGAAKHYLKDLTPGYEMQLRGYYQVISLLKKAGAKE